MPSSSEQTASSEVCGFCRGKPVGNGAAWYTLDAPRYLPCPRCGQLNLPEDQQETDKP